MRELTDVINQMTKISTDKNLSHELNQIKYDVGFTAPELMHIKWEQTHDILLTFATSPITDEMVKIFSVFSTRSEREIRESFAKE